MGVYEDLSHEWESRLVIPIVGRLSAGLRNVEQFQNATHLLSFRQRLQNSLIRQNGISFRGRTCKLKHNQIHRRQLDGKLCLQVPWGD